MDFVLLAVAATLGAAIPSGNPPSSQPFAQRHFADLLSCEQATATAIAPPRTKLICVPAGSSSLVHTAH